jgi:hypothetical protein
MPTQRTGQRGRSRVGLKPFYYLREVADMIGWSPARTRRFLRLKGVPTHRVGSRLYYKLSDLMSKLDDQAFWNIRETL